MSSEANEDQLQQVVAQCTEQLQATTDPMATMQSVELLQTLGVVARIEGMQLEDEAIPGLHTEFLLEPVLPMPEFVTDDITEWADFLQNYPEEYPIPWLRQRHGVDVEAPQTHNAETPQTHNAERPALDDFRIIRPTRYPKQRVRTVDITSVSSTETFKSPL